MHDLGDEGQADLRGSPPDVDLAVVFLAMDLSGVIHRHVGIDGDAVAILLDEFLLEGENDRVPGCLRGRRPQADDGCQNRHRERDTQKPSRA